MSVAALQLDGLRAAYGAHTVLTEISLAIEPGQWYALLGPNGCGKSTLLDCVAGRLRPMSGRIAIAGHSLSDDPFAAKRRLGFGCAPDALPGLLTARQCLEIHAYAKGLPQVGADLMRLADELRFLPYLESFVDSLSLGTRQKLAILLALVGDPALIVLDEAFNGLDPASAVVLKGHLRRRLAATGASLLLATHAIDIVEHQADRAGLLLDGRLRHEWSAGEIQSLRRDTQGFEAALAATIGG
jgi:ABC-2 type transport system ATP-binding protein